MPAVRRAVRPAGHRPDDRRRPAVVTSEPITPAPDRPRPTWLRGALVGGGLVAAVILVVVVTMSLTGGNDGKDDSRAASSVAAANANDAGAEAAQAR